MSGRRERDRDVPPSHVGLRADDVARIVAGEHGAPFDVLGAHRVTTANGAAIAVRTFAPDAEKVAVRTESGVVPMESLDPSGFWVAILPAGAIDPEASPPEYRLEVTERAGKTARLLDPYALPPFLSDFDLHLFGEGTNVQLYAKLGAHPGTHAGERGVGFAVWAPHATRVSVIGVFNGWDERRHPMRWRGASGLWEIFLPGVEPGALYKFHIKTSHDGANSVKADPLGFRMELRPNTASVVWELGQYNWGDAEWMAKRAEHQAPDRPLNAYEVHLGSWRRGPIVADTKDEDDAAAANAGRWLTYREIAAELVPYVKDLGYTHLELLPVMEHPFDGSWGYQTTGYFAPTTRHGSPDDFKFLVDQAHQAGLGVILDWVPGHFPRDGHGLVFFDGTHLYEHPDPRKGHHRDWDTFIFDYGKPQVVEFLLSSALFWLDEYHADGLRVDAVASMLYLDYSRAPGEWVPNRFGGRENLEAVAFLKRLNELAHRHFPGVLVCAEESTAWPGVTRPVERNGLGFDLKWNMGWMNDTLAYVKEDPLARKHHQRRLTFSLVYAFSESFMLPLSHDEVVHGKRSLVMRMPGDGWKKLANLRLLYGYQTTHPGKKLLFMGGEMAQLREWSHDRQLDWQLLEKPEHMQIRDYVRTLNRVYLETPALHEVDYDHHGFEWIDFKDESRSVIVFMRRARDPRDFVIVACNWTPVPWETYRIGVPESGNYRQLVNSDDARWGGSGAGVFETIEASPEPAMRRPYSLVLTLPPLGVVILAPEHQPAAPAPPPKAASARKPRARRATGARTRRRVP